MKVLVAKQLTFSDSSYDVSKCGRVVLPRAQVQECLVELLRGGGAHSAVASVKSSAPLRLAVELVRLRFVPATTACRRLTEAPCPLHACRA